MEFELKQVLTKTPQGIYATRSGAGLSPKSHAVLKSFDGARSVAELKKACVGAALSAAEFDVALKDLQKFEYLRVLDAAAEAKAKADAAAEAKLLMTLDFSAEPAASAPVAAAPSGMTQLMTSPEGGIERREYRLKDDIDPQLLQIFLEEAAELVPQVGQDLRDWRARPADKLVSQSLKRLLHTLKGSARMAGAMALGQLTHSMESRVENAELLPAIPPNLFDDLETSFDRIGTLIARLQGSACGGGRNAVTGDGRNVAHHAYGSRDGQYDAGYAAATSGCAECAGSGGGGRRTGRRRAATAVDPRTCRSD